MKVANAVLKTIEIVRKAIKSRRLHNYSIFIFASYLILGSFLGVNAQDPTICIDEDINYQESLRSDRITGDPGLDAHNNGGTTLISIIDPVTVAFVGEGYCNWDEVKNDPEINGFLKQGLIETVDRNMMAMMRPPTQNVYQHLASDWVPGQDTGNTSVYAQDGFDVLESTGIDGLWEQTRRIAYILFVVVLIAAGFMIMFRKKIGGQMAVTIFNTIPDVIVGLLLVTFSFAIVGLVINLGAMLVNVVGGILGLAGNGIVVDSPISLFVGLVTGYDWFQIIAGSGLVSVVVAAAGALIISGGNPVVGGVIAGGGILFLLIVLVIVFIVITASIKVWVTLLKAYVGLIIDTVTGPLSLAIGTIPGASATRSDWFKRILRNALTFPIVFFFVNLGAWIFNSSFNFGFPPGLAGGDLGSSVVAPGPLFALVIKGAIMIYLFFVAAEAPKILDDFLPLAGGKATREAFQVAAKNSFGKLPIIGGAFG